MSTLLQRAHLSTLLLGQERDIHSLHNETGISEKEIRMIVNKHNKMLKTKKDNIVLGRMK
jgi:uncharacterized protein YpmB